MRRIVYNYSTLQKAILERFGTYSECSKSTGIPLPRLMRLLCNAEGWYTKDIANIMRYLPEGDMTSKIEEYFFIEVQ